MKEQLTRILIVEDDDEDFFLTRDMLGKSGRRFDVLRADRLESALRYLDSGGIDLILLDLSLPDSTGLETYARIRGHAPQVPVVILTGQDDDLLGTRAVQHGAQDFLSKARIDRDRLARSIRYAIERKHSEEDLKRYRDHLEGLVADATQELRSANEKLQREINERRGTEEKLKDAVNRLEMLVQAKTHFVSDVSHELRTPLASMSCAVENLQRGVVGPLDEKVRSYLDMIQEDCQRLSSTVSDILDLTRIEANKLVLSCRTLRFGRFVELAAAALKLQVERKGLELKLELNEPAAFVHCDPQKMERVLLNVMQNAVKFTAAGGHIRVALHASPADPHTLILDVIDDGVGIEPEHIVRLTERYFRGGTCVADGAGIGLSLSREIIELHGGRLHMQSPPPGSIRGTQVSILLPRAQPPDVLAVDDTPAIREALVAELVALGYSVCACERADAALRRLAEDPPPTILVTDLGMPEMDGVELIGSIKLNPRLRRLPVLAMSGADVEPNRKQILDGFGIPLLKKPWKANELARTLDDLIIGRSSLGI